MTIFSELKSLFQHNFSLVKYNLILTMPFFAFWLVLGFVLAPLSSARAGNGVFFTLFLILALKAAFLSGWLNMFKKCVETSVDQNLPDEKRTADSFWLFREFFPGVGKYFGKMILGLSIYFILFNIMMLTVEMTIIPIFGAFESFSPQDMINSMESHDKVLAFWKTISDSDKLKIFKIVGFECIFMFMFFYLTMFWSQLLILTEISPLRSFVASIKAIIRDFAKTFPVFFLNLSLILTIFFIGVIMVMNPIIKLVTILLFVYSLISYVMMTFLYLEKYGKIEKTNCASRTDCLG
ncbi:MAG TPA: hypothetical protein P5556_03555 [Candidatus Gastranaerophilales bacterium]|nr:hypothetical protein [Candidatus Gastranaerophilales bacterium]